MKNIKVVFGVIGGLSLAMIVGAAASVLDSNSDPVSTEQVFTDMWDSKSTDEKRDICNAIILFGIDGVASIMDQDRDTPAGVDTVRMAELIAQECDQ